VHYDQSDVKNFYCLYSGNAKQM